MAIKLEETAHGIGLEVGALIRIKILSRNDDECFGYFSKIDDKGIILSMSKKLADYPMLPFKFLVPLEDIAEVSQIVRYAEYSLRIKR